MYFPDNIPNLYQYDELKVLDCGAFDGDTLREFEARNPSNISKYLAIDISSKNLQSLLSHYNLAPDWLETKQVAIGVPQNSKLIVIENGSSSCIRLVEENNNEFTDNEVSSTTLANLGKDILFNVIKVDIEGADYPALKDSIDYIKKSRPTLALSIYHRPEDLWEIPLLFISLFTDSYEYYIRNEGHWGYETIFYAVPKRNNF